MPASRLQLLVRLVVVVLFVVLDQVSKSWVFEHFYDIGEVVRHNCGNLRVPLSGEWLGVMLSTNKGAAFGGFQDFPHVLVGGRGIAVLVLAWMVLRAPRGQRMISAAMVLVLAGAIGNLLDNLWSGEPLEGHPYLTVRDFIDVYFSGFDWHFPSFNVADACISVGAVLWILSGFLQGKDENALEPGDTGSSGDAEPERA